MSAVITSIVCGIIVNPCLFFIIQKLFNSKEKLISLKNICLIVILSIFQSIFYNENYNVIYIIVNYISIMIINKLIFKENMSKTIISTSIVFLILMLSDFIDSIIMVNITSFESVRSYWYLRLINNAIVSILCYVIFIIFNLKRKLRYFVSKYEDKHLTIMIFFFILVFAIIIATYTMSIDFKWDINYIANIFILIALIIFCYIFINENNEFNILNEKYDSLFNYVQTFENWIEKEQLNRHEYKNQLASIRCITKEKKVRDKIDSIMLDNINITNDTVNQLKPIPNGGLKGLLYYKIAIAENNKLKIELDISIKNPEIIKKLSEDKIKILCRLLGIYLDNAIEAAKETKKKIISIEIYEVDKNINIVITNTFDNTNDISKRNDKGFTTKGHGHGKGLYFAKKMIDKSNWLEESQSILDKYYIQRLIIKK